MAGQEHNFTLTSSSPLFSFKPYSEGDPQGGWGTRYSKSGFNNGRVGELGQGTPSRVTQLNGSSVALKFHGTAIYLMGHANATYSVTVDGKPQVGFRPSGNILFAAAGLAQGDHVVELLAKPSSSAQQVELDEAIFTTLSTPFHNVNIGLTHPALTYSGPRWMNETVNGVPPFIVTDETKDSVSLKFANSTGIAVIGPATFGSGGYTISIDDDPAGTFNASSLWLVPNATLFLATNLDPNVEHTLTYTNENQGQGIIAMSSITLFKAGESSSADTGTDSDLVQTAKTTILGTRLAVVIALGVLVVLISIGILWYRRRRRNQKKTKPASPVDEEQGTPNPEDDKTESESEAGEKGSVVDSVKEALDVIQMVAHKIDGVQKGLQGNNGSS